MARKITLILLDDRTAKTVGWPLRYAARQLARSIEREDGC